MNRDLLRVDAHAGALARALGDTVEIAGFTARFPSDPDEPAVAVPQTLPDDPTALAADLAALGDAFAARGQPLRVELVTLAWRELLPALGAAGLEVVDESPLFVCRPGGLQPRSGPATLRWVSASDDLAFVASLVRQGFELRGDADNSEAAEALRAATAGPLRIAVAQMGTIPAGSGCSTPLGEVTEISSVSTLPNLRRRGVGGQIVSFLAAEHFATGGTLCWACAPDVRAAALLLDVGFDDAGLRVCFAQE